jgi:diguanylate cyclase (GGDEF)-like protein
VTQKAASDLLGSIFDVATEIVGGERASLLLRRAGADDFVIARARGLAEEIVRAARIREGEGVAGRVAASKRPLLVRARQEAPAVSDPGRYRSESFVSVPIVVGDRTQAVLNVADRADGRPFDQSDLDTLELLGTHIATCLLRQRLDEELRDLAEIDGLTHLFNRRHFDRRLEAELSRARRMGDPLSVLILNVNSLRRVNEQLGQAVGDDVVRSVAAAVRRSLRVYDVPIRYGGDQFAIILPSADAATARLVGERVVGAVAAFAISTSIVAAVPDVGLSVGVATAPPAADAQALVERAHAAMEDAHQRGGGVSLWDPARGSAGSPSRRPALGTMPAPYLKDPARLAKPDLQRLIPSALAEEFNVLVIGREGQVITVAMPEPSPAATEALSSATGFAVYPVYSAATEIERARRAVS